MRIDTSGRVVLGGVAAQTVDNLQIVTSGAGNPQNSIGLASYTGANNNEGAPEFRRSHAPSSDEPLLDRVREDGVAQQHGTDQRPIEPRQRDESERAARPGER